MIKKIQIRKEFMNIKRNIPKAKTKEALKFLEKQTEKIRRGFINIYVNPIYKKKSFVSTLEKEYNIAINRIRNKLKKFK